METTLISQNNEFPGHTNYIIKKKSPENSIVEDTSKETYFTNRFHGVGKNILVFLR